MEEEGCRDCDTCTKSVVGRMMQSLLVGLLYLTIVGWLVKKGFMRHCPHCEHLLRSHERRADGSFRD